MIYLSILFFQTRNKRVFHTQERKV